MPKATVPPLHRLLASLTDICFVRFVLVGVLNTAFSYALFVTLVAIGVHYTVATLISTTLGVMFNFKTTGVWVFNSRDNRRIFGFVAIYTLACFVNMGCQRICHAWGIGNYLAGLLAMPPSVLLVYLLSKHFVFKH